MHQWDDELESLVNRVVELFGRDALHAAPERAFIAARQQKTPFPASFDALLAGGITDGNSVIPPGVFEEAVRRELRNSRDCNNERYSRGTRCSGALRASCAARPAGVTCILTLAAAAGSVLRGKSDDTSTVSPRENRRGYFGRSSTRPVH